MSVTLVEVNNKNLEKAFIDLPWALYKDDPHWVPPLKMAVRNILNSNHPFYDNSEIKLWLAQKDNMYLGRIAAIINRHHNDYHRENCGFFGFFECVEDHEVAQALFHKAESWLRKKGMSTIRGPVSPSTNYEVGVLVKGFSEAPMLMMTYNKRYYPGLIENAGFKKAKDLLAYDCPTDISFPEKLQRVANRSLRGDRLKTRALDRSNWDREVDLILEIYNDAWEKNWGFVPMTEKEFRHLTNDLKPLASERFIRFIEYNGTPAGFIIGLLDYNQVFKKIPSGRLFPTGLFKMIFPKRHIDRIRVITIGVKKKYQHLGLASLLIYDFVKEVRRYNTKKMRLKRGEMGWVLEDNESMNRPLQIMGAKAHKTYRLYEKATM